MTYKFSVDSDIGYRTDLFGQERWQYRSGIKYQATNNLQLRAGVMYVHGNSPRTEFRPYQDIIINNRINSLIISNRVRFEQQVFNNAPTNFRIRYNPTLKVPTQLGVLSIGTEPFINTNSWDEIRITSNRIYFGVSRNMMKNTMITLQYINEKTFTSSEISPFEQTHFIRLKIDHKIHPLESKSLFKRKKKR
ncbi:hypothetical protein AVL50_08625 [Flammeovirga sp. SJP92]|nr:hypothetical protein AVL50_08625 [Flammeovirga sp. SJP92]